MATYCRVLLPMRMRWEHVALALGPARHHRQNTQHKNQPVVGFEEARGAGPPSSNVAPIGQIVPPKQPRATQLRGADTPAPCCALCTAPSVCCTVAVAAPPCDASSCMAAPDPIRICTPGALNRRLCVLGFYTARHPRPSSFLVRSRSRLWTSFLLGTAWSHSQTESQEGPTLSPHSRDEPCRFHGIRLDRLRAPLAVRTNQVRRRSHLLAPASPGAGRRPTFF